MCDLRTHGRLARSAFIGIDVFITYATFCNNTFFRAALFCKRALCQKKASMKHSDVANHFPVLYPSILSTVLSCLDIGMSPTLPKGGGGDS